MQLSPSAREQLKAVLKEPIVLQIFVDDLLVWGLLGEREVVYSSVQWEIHYNSDQITQVVYKPTHPIKLASPEAAPDQFIDLSYSVTWLPTSNPFETRLQHHEDPGHFESEEVWLILLVSFISTGGYVVYLL